jgi:hypothetical protein
MVRGRVQNVHTTNHQSPNTGTGHVRAIFLYYLDNEILADTQPQQLHKVVRPSGSLDFFHLGIETCHTGPTSVPTSSKHVHSLDSIFAYNVD